MSYDVDFITHLPIAVAVMDHDLELLAASRDMFALFAQRLHAERYHESLQALSKAIAAREDLIARVAAATLKLHHVGSHDVQQWEDAGRVYRIVVFTLPPAEAPHYGVRFEDITAEIEFEQGRENTRSYLERILNGLPIGVVVMDRDMRVTTMNTTQRELFRFAGKQVSLVEVVGTNASELFADERDPTWAEIAEPVLARGEVLDGIVRRYSHDNTERFLSEGLAPLRDNHDDVIGAIRLSSDITRQTELEASAREADVLAARLETVRQLTITFNHEVNTALTTVLSGADALLYLGRSLPEDQQALIGTIKKQAERIRTFVERLSSLDEIRPVPYLEDDDETMLDITGADPS